MECVIFKYVNNHFHSNDVFFLSIKPVFTWPLCINLLRHLNVNDGRYCCMVLCDLSKAFNRVWHKKSLSNLIVKVLEINAFYTVVQCLTRYVYTVYAGVPQGSVLGPLLIFLFMSITLTFLRLCADDNSLQQNNETMYI